MLVKMQLRLSSPFLGDKKSASKTRLFQRDSQGFIALDIAHWNWAVRQAVESLHMDEVDPTTIRPALAFPPPCLVWHKRTWPGANNRPQEEAFEAIRAKTVITMDVMITSTPEDPRSKLRPPLPEEFMNIMNCIGKMIGLSPWGNNFGYGRFTVVKVEEQSPKPIYRGIEPAPQQSSE